jgi:hypothetical protein
MTIWSWAYIRWASGFGLKIGCDRSGIRAVLTIGRKPRVDWMPLRTYSLQNYFFKALVPSFSLFCWFYLNYYLNLSYFQILDGPYSPHRQEKHWSSAHWTASAKGCAASVGTTAQLTVGGGTIRDYSHSTSKGRLARSSTDAAEPRPWLARRWRWQQGWRRRRWRLHSLEQRREGWDIPRCQRNQNFWRWSPDPHWQTEGFVEPHQHHHPARI